MNRSRSFLGLVTAMLFVATASLAQAQNNALYWNTAGPAPWSNSGNWTAGAGTYNGTIINNGGTATIASGDNLTDNSGGASASTAYVYVGGAYDNGSGNGYVSMSGGVLNGLNSNVPLQEILGVASGSGIFTQSGGANNSQVNDTGGFVNWFSSVQVGYGSGAYGEYNLQGGSLNPNALFVGANNLCSSSLGLLVYNAGTGVFTQTGGVVGSTGAVGLSVGGNWTGGNGQSYTLGQYSSTSSGVYTLGNANGTGSPQFFGGCEAIGVNGTGTFTQNCGTNTIAGGGSFGLSPGSGFVSYNNNFGALLIGWYSGQQHPGTGSNVYEGTGVGTYNLAGGLLTGGNPGSNALGEVVGVGSTGTFNQTGGTNALTAALYVGGAGNAGSGIGNVITLPTSPGYGVYALSGGRVDTVQNQGFAEDVGAGGTGIFTQTGGVNVTRQLNLGGRATSWAMVYKKVLSTYKWVATPTTFNTPGTYNLNGGVLQANTITNNAISDVVNGGYYSLPTAFNFTAGTLQAGGTAVYSGQTLPGGLNIGTPLTLGTRQRRGDAGCQWSDRDRQLPGRGLNRQA